MVNKLSALFFVFVLFSLLLGCAGPQKKVEPEKVTQVEVTEEADKQGLCVGDYICSAEGSEYKVGAEATIEFDIDSCPNSTILDDGSEWEIKTDSCRCD